MLIAAKIADPGFITAMGWTSSSIRAAGSSTGPGWAARRAVHPLRRAEPVGMGWVLGIVLTSPLFLLLAGPIRSLGAAFLEAGAVAGASSAQRLRYIVVPLMWPADAGRHDLHGHERPVDLRGAGPARRRQRRPGRAGHGVVLRRAPAPSPRRPCMARRASWRHRLAGGHGRPVLLLSGIGRSSQFATISAANRRARLAAVAGGQDLGTLFVWVFLVLGVVLPLLVLIWNSLLPFYHRRRCRRCPRSPCGTTTA